MGSNYISEFCSLIFVGKMCVFVSRPMKLSLFIGKTLTPKNGLLIFLWKETHSETKSWNSSRISTTSYNNNGNPWKSSRILRVNPNLFIFLSLFHHLSPFLFVFFFFLHFHFLILFIFSIFHFSSFSLFFFSFSFSFLSFSIIFYHFLSFFFIFFVVCSKSDFFWASISLRFLLTVLM